LGGVAKNKIIPLHYIVFGGIAIRNRQKALGPSILLTKMKIINNTDNLCVRCKIGNEQPMLFILINDT
jgi:hypothetical protein